MQFDQISKVVQIGAAALGIPAAAAGTYSAYQTYFTNVATCTSLRASILSTMEKKIPPDAKRTLLRKDVNEFENKCAETDPDGRTLFHHMLQESETALSSIPNAPLPAAVSASSSRSEVTVFGMRGHEESGWVAVSRKVDNSWQPNFSGYTIRENVLPPAGTILTALQPMPIWQEPQAGANEATMLRSSLPRAACVRVVATRVGSGRLWAEVVPTSCS